VYATRYFTLPEETMRGIIPPCSKASRMINTHSGKKILVNVYILSILVAIITKKIII
jgi:hypothetical protein